MLPAPRRPNKGIPSTSNNGSAVWGQPGPNDVQSLVPDHVKGAGRGAAQRYGTVANGIFRHFMIPFLVFATSLSLEAPRSSHLARAFAVGEFHMIESMSSAGVFKAETPTQRSPLVTKCTNLSVPEAEAKVK